MMRYLVRLANSQGYTPTDIKMLQAKIRELLGSADKIGNLRVSTSAIEFDLFAEQTDLNKSKSLLEEKISKVVTLRPIDPRVITKGGEEMLREGVDLFNQERFWEAHEVLEEIWHPATGVERDIIQGLILTAAALVHYQKNENAVCVSILVRAMEKLGKLDNFKGLNIKHLRAGIEQILKDNMPELLRIEWVKTKTHAQPREGICTLLAEEFKPN
jgi:predicted metal-dependent hydrolase